MCDSENTEHEGMTRQVKENIPRRGRGNPVTCFRCSITSLASGAKNRRQQERPPPGDRPWERGQATRGM